MSMDDARLDHFRQVIANDNLKTIIESGELTVKDLEWLIDKAGIDIGSGPIDWRIVAASPGFCTFTMRSTVKPTTWLSMFIDRRGWEEIKRVGNTEIARAEQL